MEYVLGNIEEHMIFSQFPPFTQRMRPAIDRHVSTVVVLAG
jgi:hypothetical protein